MSLSLGEIYERLTTIEEQMSRMEFPWSTCAEEIEMVRPVYELALGIAQEEVEGRDANERKAKAFGRLARTDRELFDKYHGLRGQLAGFKTRYEVLTARQMNLQSQLKAETNPKRTEPRMAAV